MSLLTLDSPTRLRGVLIPFLRKAAFAGVLGAVLLAPLMAHAQDAAAERTLAAQARLTTTLVQGLQPMGKENAVLSPAGVAAVFALLDLGTSDGFRDAAHNVLGYDRGRAAAADFEDLRDQLASVDHLNGNSGGTFTFANAAVFDPKLNANPDVIARMRQAKAEVSVLPLADRTTVNAINDWVARKTNNLIPQIVNDNIADAGLIALNALYFKDDWAVSFNKAQTQLAAFRDSGGGVTDVPMMHGTMNMPFRAAGRFAAVDLRYKSGRFSLTLVTTRDTPATFAEFSGVTNWLSGDEFELSSVNVAMPRFTLRQSMDLLPALDAVGLANARHDRAAFAPITRNPLDISAILQKVYVGINEQGTEAAAATSVMVRAASIAPTRVDAIALDKPFIFALRDNATGLILLSGYIGKVPPEPTQ
jgi:serine protease inhibitor